MTIEAPGCDYREQTNGPTCKKLCDPGNTMCPHHKLLAETRPSKKAPKKPRATKDNEMPSAYSQ